MPCLLTAREGIRWTNMVSKLGLVFLALIAMMLVLVLGLVPLDRSVQAWLLSIVVLSTGGLALFKTKEVISPWFASSRFQKWLLRGLGLVMTLMGLAALINLAGSALGLW
jgi:hypothetical protein